MALLTDNLKRLPVCKFSDFIFCAIFCKLPVMKFTVWTFLLQLPYSIRVKIVEFQSKLWICASVDLQVRCAEALFLDIKSQPKNYRLLLEWERHFIPPSLNDSINSSNINQSGILTFGKFDKGWDWWDWSGGKIYCPLPPRPPNWTRRTHPGSRLAPGLDGNIIWDLESHFTVFSYYWAKMGIFCQPPLLGQLAMHSFVRGRGNDMINENKNSCDIRDQRVKTPLSCCLVVLCCLGHWSLVFGLILFFL